MSRQQTGHERMKDAGTQAFEYVTGTLRGTERDEFARQLQTSTTLRREVSFWEEQLFGLHNTEDTLAPRADTWQKISAGIAAPEPRLSTPARRGLLAWLPWGLSGALSLVLLFTLTLGPVWERGGPPAQPADYVAVLTDAEGGARLTALTAGDSQTMWLQWGEVELAADRALQLWAISRSDGETRSIAVLETTGAGQLALSDAHWRLVTDASFLILTEEESGGSPLDEPSDIVLARGECVRFEPGTNPS
ncbi:hypothetical protein FKG94_20010 [Exilibacterium tricleocarpae]|uniref:Anti-sigma K factor RskA C-terminal domain-containing protein n=1 Tax=Exilibacterium tricleocarpae TaxID=2591008 RepID=A0A545T1V5_9GAMM|nr:anti-sigma factor [Exilibacterium tricleocarpae]TQV71175.1 hypothetical protein FKG94_20010 [Exilibacterium tricleocarpae]